MPKLKYPRFTKIETLEDIGQPLLAELFTRIHTACPADHWEPPDAQLPEREYFARIREVLKSPGGLPDEANLILCMIHDLASDTGKRRLLRAIERAGLEIPNDDQLTCARLAMRLWLINPALVAKKHREQLLVKLTTFEHWGSNNGCDLSSEFIPPDGAGIERIVAAIDAVCVQEGCGAETVSVEHFVIGAEHFFTIEYGDTYERILRRHGRTSEVLHFPPSRQDVVVYNPRLDEIRVRADKKWRSEAYRTIFGRCLRSDPNHFNQFRVYTLQPLAEQEAEALTTDGVPELTKIVLRTVEIERPGGHHAITKWKSDNLLESEWGEIRMAMRSGGRLKRVGFWFYFGKDKRPRLVEIEPDSTLKLGRECDVYLVNHWLALRGFRVIGVPASPYIDPDTGNAETVAVS